MIEITNKNKFPVQIVVRSKKSPSNFTCLNIPGIGSGKNVKLIEDEQESEGTNLNILEKKKIIRVKRINTSKRI